MDFSFYNGKKVLVTGHTGFKGSWMCAVLKLYGAKIIGYSLEPKKDELFQLTDMQSGMESIVGDIRDLKMLNETFDRYQPEIVIHMAAQPIVRESYENPVYTYETNVMGTVNVLEAIRLHDCVKSFVNVTTDKVYKNKEWEWGYREVDELNGYDPYSNSKSCSELVTSSYKNSFFEDRGIAISTCRAGNVIGGGDFARDRIIPDCIRAQIDNTPIIVRNSYSVRPYQHVLEPVCAYLMVAMLQYQNKEKYEGNYNIGPEYDDCLSTGKLVDLFVKHWGENARWISQLKSENEPHEANFLRLDCSKAKAVLDWQPKWNIEKAVEATVEWSKEYIKFGKVSEIMEKQIRNYLR